MVRRSTSAIGIVLAAASLAGAAASCSTFSSDDGPAPTSDAGGGGGPDGAPATCSPDLTRDSANCGQCGHACMASEACENGACRPGCANKIVYVSSTGSDDNDGCAIARPMKTIGAAVARVKAIGATNHTVAVCRGGYSERALVIDYPVSLRGGYECSQFTRTKDFGYPLFDAATETSIDDANVGADRATLTVKGAAVTRATIIDGFTINGAVSGDVRSIAVSVLEGASATLSDLRIEGGGTNPSSGIGSRGIHTASASPEITRTLVHGGTGQAADNANADVIGVHCTGGVPYLHDLGVYGATAVVRTRSYAVLVDGNATITGPNRWHDVSFDAGRAALVGVGLFVTGAQLEVSHANLTGGQTTCQVMSCGLFGALVSIATVAIDGSRIYGGDMEGPVNAAFAPSVYGVYVDGLNGSVPPSVFTNNVILAGNAQHSTAPRVIGALLSRAPGTRFVHNTVLVPEAPGGLPLDTVALWASYSSSNVEVDDNLLVGQSGSISLGLRIDRDCNVTTPSSFKYLRSNAFVGLGRVLDAYGSACAYSTTSTLVDAKTLLPDATMTGNVRLAPSCGNDSAATCRVCSPASACAPVVLAPWSPGASPTPAELFSAGGGYTMAPNAPCMVAKGAATLSPPVTVDGAGTMRPDPASIGASQIAGACAP